MISIAFHDVSYFLSQKYSELPAVQLSFIIEFVLILFQYCSLGIKFYEILVTVYFAFDYLCALNPFVWPLSLLYALVQPYFTFWNNLFPYIKVGPIYIEAGTLFASKGLDFLTKVPHMLERIAVTHFLKTGQSRALLKESFPEESAYLERVREFGVLLEEHKDKLHNSEFWEKLTKTSEI